MNAFLEELDLHRDISTLVISGEAISMLKSEELKRLKVFFAKHLPDYQLSILCCVRNQTKEFTGMECANLNTLIFLMTERLAILRNKHLTLPAFSF